MSRALRPVVIVVLVLVVLAVSALAALPEILRRAAMGRLAAMTGRTVMLEAVDVGLWSGRFALRGLRVVDRDLAPLLTVERLEIRFRPRALLRGHLHITDGRLGATGLRIVRTGPHEFNVSDLLVRRSEGGTGATVIVERFDVRDVAVVIEDRTLTPPRTWRVEAVTVDVRDVSTLAEAPPGRVTLSAVVASSPISLSVTDLGLAPLRFRATLGVREIDASLAALYLPPASPLSPARGTVSVSAAIDHDAPTGTRVNLDARGAGIELRRPEQASAFLSAPEVRVAVADLRIGPDAVELGRLAVDGGTMFLEDARLGSARRWQADGVLLEARNLTSARGAPAGFATAGAAMAGARLSVYAAELRLDPLELHATAIVRNVDLALLRLYLPPELPVRPERGVVNATLRVDHDTRLGTRLALDAGLGNLELARPAHFVTAPALRIAAQDIALDRGAVTVGHFTVDGARLTLEERTVTPIRKWIVQDLAVEAKSLSSRREDVQGIATVRAKVAGATLSGFVTGARLAPLELHATTILRNVDLALLRLYLPPDAPVQLARGAVDASVQVDHTVADGTRVNGDATLTGLEARGRGAAATLAVAAPSLRVVLAEVRHRATTLSVGRVELTGSGSVVDSRSATARVDLAQLRVVTEDLGWPIRAPARMELSARFRDRGELEARGTAQLTAPLPEIAWAAELALRFRAVDLAPLAPYVPAARGLGGRVRGDLAASVAYAGSLTGRVRGDIGGARFALADGGRTLLSLRRVDATGLDVQWPERVSVKQIRLQQPYAFIERDRQGRYPLAARLAPPPPADTAPAPAAGAARPASPSIAVGELVVEGGSAAIVAETAGRAPARIDLPKVDLTARDVTWPATKPVAVLVDAGLPAGGTVRAEGTVTAEPASVDLKLVLTDADLSLLQPYLAFRAKVRGRLDTTLTVAGPLVPAPQLSVRGDARLRSLAVADGQRAVVTVDRIRATGIDAAWPGRLSIDRVRIRRSWAAIERDRQGDFLLRTLLVSPADGGDAGARATPAPPAPSAGPALAFTLREGVLEEQSVTVVDGVTTPPTRFDIAGARLAVRDLTWPSRGPMTIELTSPTPVAGRLDVKGAVDLEPVRLDLRAILDGVALEPAQPYLPIEGRVAGQVTGELAVKVALPPVTVRVTGQTHVRAFRLSDADRPLVTVGRLEAAGIDVDWPRRIALGSVQLRRPRLLIERDAQGEILLLRAATPRWTATAAAGASGPTPTPAQPPTVEVATINLERASARFVDQTTTPPYVEELSRVGIVVTGLTTVPGRRARFDVSGDVGGGSFKLTGEAAAGDRPVVDLKVDLRDFVVPRANPYAERFTGWAATQGSLTASATYSLNGTRLDARHDLTVRGLEVAGSEARDEAQRRLGLPLSLLVSLLKDARGEIKLSLPVSADLSSREFDFQDAVWSAVRALTLRLVALPFSRIGSLLVSQDSKVEAVAIAPVVFETGTARLGAQMESHLTRVATFLRGAPAVSVVLRPILIQADVAALRAEQVRARLAGSAAGDPLEAARGAYRQRWPERPSPTTLEAIVAELATVEAIPVEAMRGLAGRRADVVRQALASSGGDAERLRGNVPRTPLVEAAGAARVELDLRAKSADRNP